MEFFKPGLLIDFMKYRRVYAALSAAAVLASLVSYFVPGPNYGIDFKGGTEVQMAFKGSVQPGELRKALEDLGYDRPDVVNVQGAPNEYIVRVSEVSNIPERQAKKVERQLRSGLGATKVVAFKVSPGGDKIGIRLGDHVEPANIQDSLSASGLGVRSVKPFGPPQDHRYEAHLTGVAEELVRALSNTLGERGPEQPRRIEWVGPKAGAQLRDAAIKSLLYAIAFIMVYVAFRFDLRFAPGAVIASAHDALITMGIFVLLGKEVNLTTVAALLTIIGYSINDTIVVYDRIRENLGRHRDKGLRYVINLSTSQMLSRTIVTSGTTLLSVSAFFVWGTAVIRDISFALMIGIVVGTYSSIYIAAPLTEWMDRTFFKRRRHVAAKA